MKKGEQMFWRISTESLENVNNFLNLLISMWSRKNVRNVMHFKIFIFEANFFVIASVICYAWEFEWVEV
jgi:hypothetical protein